MATTHHRAMLLSWPAGRSARSITAGTRLVAAALLVGLGLIHLDLAPVYYESAAYIGALFFVTCAVAWLTAAAIVIGLRGAWLAGVATALGAGTALLLSATTGLPGFTDSLAAPYATLSLVLEASLVVVYAAAFGLRRNLLLTPRTVLPAEGPPSR